jgi:hypothetical protein
MYATIRAEGDRLMIILNRDGTLTTDSAPEHNARPVKEIIEVPDHLVTQQPDLIEHIFTFAFDVLGLQAIDIRIRPASMNRSAGALYNAPCL